MMTFMMINVKSVGITDFIITILLIIMITLTVIAIVITFS